MTLATIKPAPALEGKPCVIRFELVGWRYGVQTNYMRAWCTSAPEGSRIGKQLVSNQASRVQVYEGAGGELEPWRTTFDKGGVYKLQIQEYIKSGGWGGGYEGDPRGAPIETQVSQGVIGSTEGTTTLEIAERFTQRIGAGDDTAELVVWARGSALKQTLVQFHGEATPAIINPSSDRARQAAESSAVTTAVTNMIDSTTASALGNLGTVLDNLLAFTAHSNNVGGAYHDLADDQSDLAANYVHSTSLAGVAAGINKLRRRFSQHIVNSKENDPTHPEYQAPGGIEIHSHAGYKFDLYNGLLNITANENDQPTIYAAMADFWRAYEAHRVFAGPHNIEDPVNALNPLTGILAVHLAFLSELASIAPSTPPGQSGGAVGLVAQGGFVKT